MTIIKAGTTSTTGFVVDTDASGTLILQSGGSNTAVAFNSQTQQAAFTHPISQPGSFMFRNKIINGNFAIWQRNTSITNITNSVYTADRFYANLGTPGTGVFRVDQVSDAPENSGLTWSLKLSPTTAMSSVAGATYLSLVQLVEGFNCADLMYGTPYARTCILTYWVKSNVPGLCCGTIIQNSAAAGTERSYPYNFTISSADTWQLITIVVPGDTSVSIANNNTWGLQFNFGYMAIGSNFQNGSLNTWNANPSGTAYLPSGFTYLNRANSTSNYLSIAGVQFEIGSVATPFEQRPMATEMNLCTRYFYRMGNGINSFLRYALGDVRLSTEINGVIHLPNVMRATPTASISSASHFAISEANTNRAMTSFGISTMPANPAFVFYTASVASGLTPGRCAQLISNNTTASFIDFSAEL